MTEDLASFERVDREGEPTLLVAGEVDLAVKDVFRDQLDGLIAEAHSPAYVDMSRVSFFDSSAIGALVAARGRGRELGVEITVVRPSPQVRRVLSITGLDQMISVRD